MVGYMTVLRGLRGKARRISRHLGYEDFVVECARRLEVGLNDHNRGTLGRLYALPQPTRWKDCFDWTNVYENGDIEKRRKLVIEECFGPDVWDRSDPGLLGFLEELLVAISVPSGEFIYRS